MTEIEELRDQVNKLKDMIESNNAKTQSKLLSKSDIVLFIAEAFARWGKRSPKYMRIWKSVNWVIAALSGLPFILGQLEIIPTTHWQNIITQVVMYASLYGSVMNTLVVAKPDPNAMPLTEKKQIQDEIKYNSQPQAS